MTQQTVISQQAQQESDQPKSVADRITDLRWYEWAWIGFPLLFGFFGGMLGALIFFPAASINYGIMKSERVDGALQYIITGAISFVAFIIYLVLAVVVLSAIGID